MVPRSVEVYKPTESRVDCNENPDLRLAQVFLGVNLLCQANTFASLTKAELYFYVVYDEEEEGSSRIYACPHLSRDLQQSLSKYKRMSYLGTIVTNCVVTTTVERIHKMTYCPNPELFGSQFLLNVEVAKKRGGVLNFLHSDEPESQPARFNKIKNREKQVEVVAVETENDTTWRTEDAPSTLHIQEEVVVLSTSATPELSPENASLVKLAIQQDKWRVRMEGLMERIALNTDIMALKSEAHTQLLTSQTEIQRTYHEDDRTAVFTVREMVSLMAETFIPQRKRAPHHAAQGSSSRRSTGRDNYPPRTADSRRDQPWR